MAFTQSIDSHSHTVRTSKITDARFLDG